MRGRVAGFAALLLLVPLEAASTDARSPSYRLVGAAAASTSSVASSAAYSLYLVGGSGEATGISASANLSAVSGGTSTTLPTDQMFADSLE